MSSSPQSDQPATEVTDADFAPATAPPTEDFSKSGLSVTAPLYFLALLIVTIGSWCCAVSFWDGQTEYVKELGLANPSQPGSQAGRYLGAVILSALSIGLSWLCLLFKKHVLDEYPSYDKVSALWSSTGSKLGHTSADLDDAVASLSEGLPNHHRVSRVLASWQDASPNSDAEYVIEGLATPVRQNLGVLQTLASILVLIGLVGNFFGLSEAVRKLPELSEPALTAKPADEPGEQITTKTPVAESKTGAVDIGMEDQPSTTPSLPEEDTKANKALNGIADSLQVVVISSVAGIGAMAILLLFVAAFKAMLNALLAKEIVLMSAEIGSVLRPPGVGAGAGGSGLPANVQRAFESLPEKLLGFDASAANMTKALGAHGTDFGKIAESLDGLLKHQLQDAQEAYTTYHTTLAKFTAIMEDERAAVVQLADVSHRLCDGLETIAGSVNAAATNSQQVGERFSGIQLHYETYLQGARDELQQNRDILARIQDVLNQDDKARLEAQLQAITESTSSVAERMSASLDSLLGDLRDDLIKSLAERHEGELRALEAITGSSLDGWSQQTTVNEKILAAGDETLQAARGALETSQNRLAEVHDLITHQQEVTLREIVGEWKAQLAEQSQNSLSEIKITSEHLAQQVSRVPEFVTDLDEVKRTITLLAEELRSLRQSRADEHQQTELQRASSEAHLRKDLIESLNANLRPLVTAAEQSAAVSVETAKALQDLQHRFETQIDWSKVQPRHPDLNQKPSPMSRLRRMFGNEKKR